jgi:hypothetical protein
VSQSKLANSTTTMAGSEFELATGGREQKQTNEGQDARFFVREDFTNNYSQM